MRTLHSTTGAKVTYLVSALLVAASVALFITTAPGGTHFQTYWYTLSDCPAAYQFQKDPVNFIFTDHGFPNHIRDQMTTYTAWDADRWGTTQNFSNHGYCDPMDGQRYTACGFPNYDATPECGRYHIRFRQIYDYDPVIRVTAAGDAHHEDWVEYNPFSNECYWQYAPAYGGNHAVDSNGAQGSGFDMGRRELRDDFWNDNYYWWDEYWDNTRNFLQCDGDWAGSNGYVVFLKLRGLPTAVGLTSFRANYGEANAVRIVWRTDSALTVIGFNVWRSAGKKYRRLNANLIPSKVGSGAGGHKYQYVDRGAVAARTYLYKLELIAADGSRQWAGPVKAGRRALSHARSSTTRSRAG